MTETTAVSQHLQWLENGEHPDPFRFLGLHQDDQGWLVRVWLPGARYAWLEQQPLQPLSDSGCFVARLNKAQYQQLPEHYRVAWQEDDAIRHEITSPWSFSRQAGDLDLHLFAEGRHWQIYNLLGAHPRCIDGIDGVYFAVWAPAAKRVSVIGSFNNWHGLRHPMRPCDGSGIWELFIPGLHPGDLYKFEILSGHTNTLRIKTDPYARQMELRPETASVVCRSQYAWQDKQWLTQRAAADWQHQPISIYELHLGSWARDNQGHFLNYRELAQRLVGYLQHTGFTHVELLPIAEHPLDQSWGYQTSGYYAPTSRFGHPDDLRFLIDLLHQHQIGVFLDWVPAHFPRDDFALARFDGTALYEHADPRQGEHLEWGTYIFNYGRNEVRNFLIANALYWLQEFHLDGLRVDAVASMLCLDYAREEGQWLPNRYGGNENLEAIEFIKTLNHEVHAQCPGALMMAEESTSWPMVSRPTWMGGLGFSMKWNMGWMNDTLSYFKQDPIYRSHHHNQLTFSQMYAYTENFVLPLSHDEVVHLKNSLAGKMPGDNWQKMANLRLLLAWQWLNPGKKLLFMGGELGQWTEWNEAVSLDWHLLNYPDHQGIQQLVCDLNHLYRQAPALHQYEFEQQGFEWIDCNDSQHSLLSFIRKGDHECMVCLFNFLPLPRQHYPVGMPHAGSWQETLNTDAGLYGGSNAGNQGIVYTQEQPLMGQPCSALVTLPPLGAVVLTYQDYKGPHPS
ncbi:MULTISPECIES: 1,4-alpha-glucan branching protein GlgB [unclassified Oceanobacter]|uniref:1,4-alpha-glucan branching protein GlgB n=1 Tax=unclassified Oceanobacter TaxID=2620260 RepID=UPI0026E1B3DC|nr:MULTISPECIES: 1,4-alpha-glucan branching protein GlgB [unclassified Oceanobacter]MDO6681713.1 1,4-alpha-glucan branching protein GlgB [Oceanobacter sp. 5_MG-2023]MDP2505659.1 1,4-alpha-glucan branching protein GlgB [Oceanobacter sp. 3_MG-2023]